MPEEIIGVIPSSISVPLLLANIIRSQYRGSDESEDTMPYKGIWLMIRKMSKVNLRTLNVSPWSYALRLGAIGQQPYLLTPVHISF